MARDARKRRVSLREKKEKREEEEGRQRRRDARFVWSAVVAGGSGGAPSRDWFRGGVART